VKARGEPEGDDGLARVLRLDGLLNVSVPCTCWGLVAKRA